MDAQTQPKAVADLVSRLVDALTGRGLAAQPLGANMVWATHRTADSSRDDRHGGRSNPGTRQTVICRPDRDGRLAWWWLWSARTEDPEYEWLCPAKQITIAADAIMRILAVPPASVERTGGCP